MKRVLFTRNAKIPGERLGQNRSGSVRTLEDDLANLFINSGAAVEIKEEDERPKTVTPPKPVVDPQAVLDTPQEKVSPEPVAEVPKKPPRKPRGKKKEAE